MICSICGGEVIWIPLVNLTHTECKQCGAVNSQIADEFLDDDEPETEYCECNNDPTEEESGSGCCDACGGIL